MFCIATCVYVRTYVCCIKKESWQIWVSIPVPPECKPGALPSQLIPQTWSGYDISGYDIKTYNIKDSKLSGHLLFFRKLNDFPINILYDKICLAKFGQMLNLT